MVLATALCATEAGAYADDDEDANDNDVVVVTAEAPTRDTSSQSVLDRSAIDALRAPTAQDLLRSMSGVQVSQHGSEGKAAQFYMRGFDAAHGTDVTVGVDGLILNEPSHIHGHGYADSGLLIPEALAGVEARKGAFSLEQGNLSTAGHVEFEIGVPAHLRGTALGLESGRPWRGRFWAYHAPVEGPSTDVVAAELVDETGPFENRQTRRAGLIGQHTVGDWRIRGAAQIADFGLPGAIPLEAREERALERGQSLSPDTTGRTGQIWLGVVHEDDGDDWSRRTSVDLRGRQFDGHENFTGYLGDEIRGDERREFQRGLVGHLGHRSRWRLNADWELLGYAGAGFDRFRQYEDAIDHRGRAYDRGRGGLGRQANAYVAPGVAGYLGDRLEVEGGVRFEALWFQYREDAAVGAEDGKELLGLVAPRMRTRLFLGDRWMLTGGVGRGYRGPEARVFAGEQEAPPDEDLREHRGGEPRATMMDGAELGVIFEPSRPLELSATVFGYRSQAEYIYDHVSRLQVDQGPTRRLGVEFDGRLRLGEVAQLRGHAMVVDARFSADGEPVPGAPSLQGGLMAFGEWKNGVFGGLEWRAVGRRPLSFGARAAPWQMLNAHGGYGRGGWRFQLMLENVLDVQWEEGVYHYASHFDRDAPRTTIPSIHVVEGHPRMVRAEVVYRW